MFMDAIIMITNWFLDAMYAQIIVIPILLMFTKCDIP